MTMKRVSLISIMGVLIGLSLVIIAAVSGGSGSDSLIYTFKNTKGNRGFNDFKNENLRSNVQKFISLNRSLELFKYLKNVNISYEVIEFDGSLEGIKDKIAFIRSDGELRSVMFPRLWLVNGEVKTVFELIFNNLVNKGDLLHVKSIKIAVKAPEKPAITFYYAIKVEDKTTEIILEPILPFNIEE